MYLPISHCTMFGCFCFCANSATGAQFFAPSFKMAALRRAPFSMYLTRAYLARVSTRFLTSEQNGEDRINTSNERVETTPANNSVDR